MRVVNALAAVFLGLCATAVAADEPKVVGYFHSPNGAKSPFPVTAESGTCGNFNNVWIMSADLPEGYDCVFYSQLQCAGKATEHYTEDVSRFAFEVRSFMCTLISGPTMFPTLSPSQSPSQTSPTPTPTA
ncbi:uncharacterized protein GIQ15_04807 [Arthroderma uncinatum]|uniref:uncharacterized protein n=1 Tax=Arthroderma uncinatum TaxID=74035 RepID=UPI00144AAD9B|nr:uncharacterized protein GIQ15_04807 [Arthroderma uncinatum]KAF3482048.1 hypothetical protein GIQ15_04807 [Arthroderma uncinatum]